MALGAVSAKRLLQRESSSMSEPKYASGGYIDGAVTTEDQSRPVASVVVCRAALIDAAEAAIHRADCGCDGSLEPGGDDYRRMGSAAVAAVLPLIADALEQISLPDDMRRDHSGVRYDAETVAYSVALAEAVLTLAVHLVRSFAGEAS